jgi:TonB family protein
MLPAITVGTAMHAQAAQSAACAVPYADAATTDQVEPDYPPGAKDLGIGNVTVIVQVTIEPSGKLKSATIFKSSNNSEVDREALRVARESKYSPKIINCHPVEGSYVFVVSFTAN